MIRQRKKVSIPVCAWSIPVNGDEVPLYAANFVLADYGTGAVMAVPAHDTRDFAFAQAYQLPIRTVIAAPQAADHDSIAAAWTEPGTMIDSGSFDGLPSVEAKDRIIDWLAEQEIGREVLLGAIVTGASAVSDIGVIHCHSRFLKPWVQRRYGRSICQPPCPTMSKSPVRETR